MEATLGQLQEWQDELGISKKKTIKYGANTIRNVRNRYRAMGKDLDQMSDRSLRKAIAQEIRAQAEAGLYRTAERMLYNTVFSKIARERIKRIAEKQAKDLLAKEIAKRAALRWVNVAFGASIIGLIVVYLIMSIQYWGRNVMHYRWIPGLTFFDKYIYYGVNMLIALALLFIGATFILLIIIQFAPALAIAYFGVQLF